MAERKILYVNKKEDFSQETVDLYRKSTGLEFEAVFDAFSAIKMLKSNLYDGVFIENLRVPAGSAYVSEERFGNCSCAGMHIVRKAKLMGLTILVLTSFSPDLVRELEKLGVVYFVKPHDPAEILVEADRVFSG
jgi:hypothetical protein